MNLFRSKSNSSKKGSTSPTKKPSSLSLNPGSYRGSRTVSPTRTASPTRSRADFLTPNDHYRGAILQEPPPQHTPPYPSPNVEVPDNFDPLSLIFGSSELPGLPTTSSLTSPPLPGANGAPTTRPNLVKRPSSRISVERGMPPRDLGSNLPSSSPLPALYSKRQQKEESAEPRDVPRVSSQKLHWPLNMLPRTSLGSSTPLNFAGSPPRHSPARPEDRAVDSSHSFPGERVQAVEEDEVDYGDSPLDRSLQDSPSVRVAAGPQRLQFQTQDIDPRYSRNSDGAGQSQPETKDSGLAILMNSTWQSHSKPYKPDAAVSGSPSFLASIRPSPAQTSDPRSISRAQVSAPRVEQHAVHGVFVSPGGRSDFVSAAGSSMFKQSAGGQPGNYSSSLAKDHASNESHHNSSQNHAYEDSARPTQSSRTNSFNYNSNRTVVSSLIFSDDGVRDTSSPAQKTPSVQLAQPPEEIDHQDHPALRSIPAPLRSVPVSSTHSADVQRSIPPSSTHSADAQPGAIEPESATTLPPTVADVQRPITLQQLGNTYPSSQLLPLLGKYSDLESLHGLPWSQSVHSTEPRNGKQDESVVTSTMESTAFFTASDFNSSPSVHHQEQRSTFRGAQEIDTLDAAENSDSVSEPEKDEVSHDNALQIWQRTQKERPKFFKNNSVSFQSTTTNQFELETPYETDNIADFALQTGGALSESRSSTMPRPTRDLSRLPSFNSHVSSISERTDTEPLRRRTRSLSPLPLPSSELNVERVDIVDESLMATPKAKLRPSDQGPTDTVLARHVRDVEVPNTVAREYRAMHLPSSDADQSLNSAPYYNRGKASLTLKEQNSKMDRLSKENFDLKLKIHYLHQALQDRSDEGVKDMISKNAQLQADLIKAKKEIQSLRRRIRELERSGKERDEDLSASHSTVTGSETEASTRSYRQAQLEDEILYLRNRMQALELENDALKDSHLTNLGLGHDLNLLREESVRRKKAETELQTLREENARLRDGRSPTQNMSNGNQTRSQFSGSSDGRAEYDNMSGTTIVVQLKQENANLRRDLGAQTSMLSSRNRERERLQQEIEDLKIYQRQSTGPHSTSGDSILDRSVSRANYNSVSRTSLSRAQQFGDAERDQYESVQADLRDENASLRLRIQELQRELQHADGSSDIEAIRAERDQALVDLNEIEAQAEAELARAASEIDDLDAIVLQKEREIAQLFDDLDRREQESGRLQREVRAVKESLNHIVDDSKRSQSTIEHLQKELINANGDLDAMEEKIRELSDDKARLEVQQESSQSEISFLRDEQDGDKMKIGDLQSALRAARGNSQIKAFKQDDFDELQASAIKARDEVRALRKKLSTTEREAMITRNNLDGLEASLRELVGSDGNGPALLRDVFKLKRELEHNVRVLGGMELRLSEKDRLIKDRDALLEISGLESRRLADSLDKERQARKHDQNDFERTRKSSGTPDKRLAEVEKARNDEKKRFAIIEHRLSTQLHDTNNLLVSLWTELTKLCGKDWQERHASNRPSIDSITADPAAFENNMHSALLAISSNYVTLRNRIRATEQDLLKSFSVLSRTLDSRTQRIETLERTFTEHARDATNTQEEALGELYRLEDENKALRDELSQAKTAAAKSAPSLRPNSSMSRSTSSQSTSGPQVRSTSSAATLTRRSDSSTSTPTLRHSVDGAVANTITAHPDAPTAAAAVAFSRPSSSLATADQRWVLRLREMEARLRKEREGRLLDREGARKRLEEGRREIGALRDELVREKDRGGAAKTRGLGRSEGSVD